MILTCNECDTSFNFPDNLIKDIGSKVRCSKCHHVFVAYPSAAAKKSASPSPAAPKTSGSQDSAAAGVSDLDDVNLNGIGDMLDLGMEETGKSKPADGSEDLDFELDLDLEEDVTGKSTRTEFEETQELDFSDMELDGEIGESSGSGEATEGLDLDLGLDFEETDTSAKAGSTRDAAATEELSFGLDLESETDSGPDMAVSGAGEDETPAELDFELDLDEEPGPEAQSDELDFELDLETESADSGAPGKAQSDATAELELGELEDMIEVEEEPAKGVEPEAATEDLGFELDLEPKAPPPADRTADAVELEETEEFDLTDLDNMMGEDEEPSAAGGVAEVSDDIDFKLDIDEGDSQVVASDEDFEETAEFDLSDLEDMLEGDDESAAFESGAEAADLDVELDTREQPVAETELFDADDSADVELEFEVEDTATAGPRTADAAAVSALSAEEAELGDTFDMGTITDESEEAELAYEVLEDEDLAPRKKSKPSARAGLSRPFRVLLMLVLLIGGGYAVYTLSETMEFEIPFMKQLKEIQIPYVSDLLGTKVQDEGNLNIRILAKEVDGWFVENAKGGTLFVIKGQVKNNYNHARNFIRIRAKIYTKGGKQSRVKTVYAGNVLSAKELSALSPADIGKRLNRRFGDKKSNVRIKTGKTVPFMVVFSKLPINADEYTIEVASSDKG